jgi:DNA-3-methyladenine glycosylase I
MRSYHDSEWGFPTSDDRRLFEKISLEGFQSGLSWSTILNKREDFRRVFKDFDIARIAAFNEDDIQRLCLDPTIVRHQGKIRSVVNNARRYSELVTTEGSLAAYLWGFEPTVATEVGSTQCSESKLLAKNLKSRGWTFVGPTTMYALMQSLGMVNDHDHGCPIHRTVEMARQNFVRPTDSTSSPPVQ